MMHRACSDLFVVALAQQNSPWTRSPECLLSLLPNLKRLRLIDFHMGDVEVKPFFAYLASSQLVPSHFTIV